ncbi:VCBS repeat-containing protein [Pseudenhygromyxa sp. WMMC2535]|uniref:FG-GAP-like repeat-containing protein n=1 Tax=Pseudenhygromyxa sp. WMMC2535 TaxID=2712867 RepID=UPI00155564AA|nr:FG-GAP-like repeat-containing protein [Pseudenhygromyxa sp. WMMC2535]NVB40177.1 VCBS repeat-containing protein [Pseudenhygromyxa sp. WMMC2535]
MHRRALPSIFACALPTLAVACGDDGRPGDDEASETGLSSMTESSDDGSSTAETGGGSQDTSDTGVVCEEDEVACEDTCCATGEVCFEGACADDCGGEPACGSPGVCCAGSEVCYLGQCVVPAGACSDYSCATKDDPSSCDAGYTCDGDLGLCVPSQADPSCEYVPPTAEFNPRPEFTWGARALIQCADDSVCQTAEVCLDGYCQVTWPHLQPADAIENVHVSSIPVVADLDGDCVPEIVFNTYKYGVATSEGVMRAIRGDTGEQLWSVTDPEFYSDSTANPAVGDIDEDGRPEVVVQGETKYLVAIDDDGTPLWTSEAFAGAESSGAVSIANMDVQGAAEIVFGAAVYANDGTLLWEGGAGIGRDGQGPISCVADLDGDLRPELIGGNTVYKTSGSVAGGDFSGEIWWQAEVGDGRCGVADFDGDGLAEVILVRGGQIYALNGQTGETLASFNIPGSDDRGGAPNIADFNGDGQMDIGTAGSTRYVVVTFDGTTFTQLWYAVTEDDSSRVTGSSVFDFDGDGRNEVIYNDEKYIRIYPGVEPDCTLDPPGPLCDGVMDDTEVLFRDYNSSRTRTEYPVVADVDGDFKAELVFSTNADISWGRDAGIEVWGDALDNWVGTRPVWNQHSYHITNVGIDGTIPVIEESSWLVPEGDPYNAYRRNGQGSSDFCAPDLQLFDLRIEDGQSCPQLNLSVDVANLGCLGVGPGVNVSFYEEELGYLGTVQTQNQLPAGAKETVTLESGQSADAATLWAVVDDDGEGVGALNECDEENTSEQVLVCVPIG